MFNTTILVLVLMLNAFLVASQTDSLAPGEIEAPPTPVIIDFCGLSRDCNPVAKTRALGAECIGGVCVCSGSYEDIPNRDNKPLGCLLIDGPAVPIESITTTIYIEFIWNFLCDQLAETFDTQAAAVGRRMASRCGARITDFIFRRKCGSVHASYTISNVPVQTAADVNAVDLLAESVAEAASEAPTFVQLGTPAVTDITSGTSTCPVVFPTVAAHFIGGTCQPSECAPGYVLTTYESANLIDTCDEIIATNSPPVTSSSDDLSMGVIIGMVVGGVVLLLIIVAIVYLLCQRCNTTNENYESRSQQNYTTETESDLNDFYNDIHNAPDESSGAMDEESSYFDVGI
eukprot:TRINITY_DN3866_c1_g1_i1.p1 TRINITY_DN3866_c1_g1~~TRINITY_DN3866_c1_g1_i1.p1  ORF type:complete len:361 (+),score=85.83 TRINITY_DN3866_c1_g1_i1:50-1084(+)